MSKGIAGDLLSDDRDLAIATGFFAVGPTYISDGGDPEATAQARAETLADRVLVATANHEQLEARVAETQALRVALGKKRQVSEKSLQEFKRASNDLRSTLDDEIRAEAHRPVPPGPAPTEPAALPSPAAPETIARGEQGS